MKKFVILLFVSIISFSCSNDDAGFSESNLLGKWYFSGGMINGGTFESYIHDCAEERDFQEFFSNHELTFNGYNSNCEIADTHISDWKLSGNKLTVSNTHFDPMIYAYEYEIIKLTSNELIIELSAETPEGIELQRIFLVR